MINLLDFQELDSGQTNEAEVAWSIFSIFC